MHFFFKLFELFLLGLVLFLLDVGLVAVGGSDAFWDGLALKAGACVRFHGGAEALGGAWDVGTRAYALVRRGRWLGLIHKRDFELG